MIFRNLFRPRRAKSITSADIAALIQRGSESASGIEVTPDTAMRHAPVFACTRVLAESVGQLPLHVVRESGRRRTKAKDHPLWRVLHRRPNAYQTTQEWLEMVIAHLCLEGNHYSFINRIEGRVVELLPLRPGSVQPKLSADGGEVLYVVTFANGRQDVLDSSRILHVRTLSIDGIRGVTPIAYAKDALGLGIAVERHASVLFKNGARPGGVLSTEQTIDDATHERIRASWEDAHRGVDNAHRVAILEAGLRWASTGMSAEDAQMLESRQFSRTEICGLFRVPPALIGDLSGGTFSNTEQQMSSFVNLTLMPYLKRIEDRISLQLVDEREVETVYAKFNRNAIAAGDMAARSNFYTRQLVNGAMSPNEIRELEDLDPREGGDVFLLPLNMMVVNEDGEVVSTPTATPPPPGSIELPSGGSPTTPTDDKKAA